MDINHISVSRYKCFDLCSQQYKYRYHLKLASPVPEPFYFTYGTIVHKISELYVNGKGERPIGDISQDIIRGKIELKDGKFCPPIPEEYKKKLTKHLRAIQNLTERIGCEGIVEHEFRYDLDPPNNRCVTGFIDRLIIKGDKAFIIDYKTTKKGKFRVDATSVKDDLQLRMYARVVQREYNFKPENIKAALFYLEGENLVAAQYSEDSLVDVEQELLKAFHRIEKSDPDKVWGHVSWHCKHCDYASICPFYNGQGGNNSKWDGALETLGHTGWGD